VIDTVLDLLLLRMKLAIYMLNDSYTGVFDCKSGWNYNVDGNAGHPSNYDASVVDSVIFYDWVSPSSSGSTVKLKPIEQRW